MESNIDRINNIDLQWDTQYDMTGDGKITVRHIDIDEYGNPILSTNRISGSKLPMTMGRNIATRSWMTCGNIFQPRAPRTVLATARASTTSGVCDEGYTGIDCSNVSCPDDSCYFDYLGHTHVCEQCNNRGYMQRLRPVSMRIPCIWGVMPCEYDCLNDCNGNGVCDQGP